MSSFPRRPTQPWSASVPCPAPRSRPDTILLELTDPQLQQLLLNAQLGLQQAQADYKSLEAQLQSTLMDKKTAAAQVNADYTQDQLQAQTDKSLYDLGVISGVAYSKSKNTADQLDDAAPAQHAATRCERESDRDSACLCADQD